MLLFPDPIEHAWGMERKMMIARLMGDDVRITIKNTLTILVFSAMNKKSIIHRRIPPETTRTYCQAISTRPKSYAIVRLN